MNTQALKDMRTLLQEVESETWKPSLDKPGVKEWLEGFGDPKGFNISSWGEEVYDLYEPCGFTACAIGHACLDDRFPKFRAQCVHGEMLVGVVGHSNNRYVMPALADYFGIEEIQAQKLFLGEFYGGDVCAPDKVTPRHVISRINQLLNGEDI